MNVVCKTCGTTSAIDPDEVEERHHVICETCHERISLDEFDGDHLDSVAHGPGKSTIVEWPAVEESVSIPRAQDVAEELAAATAELDEPDDVVIELTERKRPVEPEPTWHVFISGDWNGPFTSEEIASLVVEGRLDHESKCWRDGQDDWSNLTDFNELAAAVTASAPMLRLATPPPPLPHKRGRDEKKCDPRSELTPELREQRRASAYQPSEDVAERELPEGSDDDMRDDLFEPYNDELGDDHPSSRTSSTPHAPARNADSVLFDRSRLEALSEGKESYPPYIEEEDLHKPDSGLIDIKTLAAEVEGGDKDSGVDELVNIGGGGFGALTMGHREPSDHQPQRSEKMVNVLLFVGVAILVAVGVQVFLAFRSPSSGNDEQSAMYIVMPPNSDGEVETLIVRPGGGGTERVRGRPEQLLSGAVPASQVRELEERSESAQENQATIEEEPEPWVDQDLPTEVSETAEEREDQERERALEEERERALEGERERALEEERRRTQTARERERLDTKQPISRSKTNETQAVNGTKRSREIWEPPEETKQNQPVVDSSLPDSLTKTQVHAGMNTVANNVRRCATGQTGTIMVNATIAGESGRVTSARVTGTFAGTPAGSCAARSARRARFPRFQQRSLTIQYPFQVF